MTKIVPPTIPDITREEANHLLLEFARKHSKSTTFFPQFLLLGRRGYYRDSMGESGKNDRGIYDDAIILITPTTFAAFNANTDPSIKRKNIAVLRSGLWYYRIGIHNLSKEKSRQYKALVQADQVIVDRDAGKQGDIGFFGINIHKGSYSTTSSEGCQTIFPDQWQSFISTVEMEMKRHGVTKIPYVLTERANTV